MEVVVCKILNLLYLTNVENYVYYIIHNRKA